MSSRCRRCMFPAAAVVAGLGMACQGGGVLSVTRPHMADGEATLAIVPQKKSYAVGEDVILAWTFSNASERHLYVAPPKPLTSRLTLQVIDWRGAPVNATQPGVRPPRPAPADFSYFGPGATLKGEIPLRDWLGGPKSGAGLALPAGSYFLSASLGVPAIQVSRKPTFWERRTLGDRLFSEFTDAGIVADTRLVLEYGTDASAFERLEGSWGREMPPPQKAYDYRANNQAMRARLREFQRTIESATRALPLPPSPPVEAQATPYESQVTAWLMGEDVPTPTFKVALRFRVGDQRPGFSEPWTLLPHVQEIVFEQKGDDGKEQKLAGSFTVVDGVLSVFGHGTHWNDLGLDDQCEQAVGRYRVLPTAESLTLATVEDACSGRAEILTQGAWRRVARR
jgi:hypothetical protein